MGTEGAIKLVTEDPEGVLPFVTPLDKVGIYAESGANGMVWFFRKNIAGIVMRGSILRLEYSVPNECK